MNLINTVRIKPRGASEKFLRKQLDGLTGHIEEAGYPFDEKIWGRDVRLEKDGNPAWWVYEQTAYWLDGYVRCGILLEDASVIARASEIIYSVLNNPDADGFLGPGFLKNSDGWNRWAYCVFFRACIALYEYNGDERIVAAIAAHYLSNTAAHDRFRDVMNVEIMAWLYKTTGDERFVALAERAYNSYNENCGDDNCDAVALSDKKPYVHGVTYNEYSKLGAILYMCTGKERYLKASVNAFEKLDKMFMLPSGCPCSDEFMISDFCMESYETCDISDYTWSLAYMFAATGDAHYLDRIEKCIFNAGMGSVLENFKGLQYFSCANQIIADKTSNHNKFFRGNKWMSYRPNPGTECCPGNVNRFMPNYILNSVGRNADGVSFLLYCDCEFEVEGLGVRERTRYPLEERITFDIVAHTEKVLYFRIPEWADGFSVVKDGKSIAVEATDRFARISVVGECRIDIEFESSVKTNMATAEIILRNNSITDKKCVQVEYEESASQFALISRHIITAELLPKQCLAVTFYFKALNDYTIIELPSPKITVANSPINITMNYQSI